MSVTDTRPATRVAGESRNGADIGWSDGVTDTRPATRVTVPVAVTCKRCGQDIAGSDPLVVAVGYGMVSGIRSGDPVCVDCANACRYLLPWVGGRATAVQRSKYEHRCARCGRFFYGGRKRRYCSAACGEATRNARRDRTRDQDARPCDTCGDTFTPPRADGRYCSAACRQKAYRRRMGGAA